MFKLFLLNGLSSVAVALAGLGNGAVEVGEKMQGLRVVRVLLEPGLVQGKNPGDHMDHFFLRNGAQGGP